MKRLPIFPGSVFGALTVIGQDANEGGRGRLWQVRCQCGYEDVKATNALTRGTRVECWHKLAGQRFGRLVAIEATGVSCKTGNEWLLKCDCGELAKRFDHNLTSGVTVECDPCVRKTTHRRETDRRRRMGERRAELGGHDPFADGPRCGCGLLLPHDPSDRVRTCTPEADTTWRAFAERWARENADKPVITSMINARRMAREDGVQ